MPTHIRKTFSRAFTLIELLVVITILTLLLSFLLPSLSKARDAAKNAKCLSGARQASIAVFAYAADNRQYVVSGRTWYANAIPGSPGFPYFGVLCEADYAQAPLFTSKGGCPWGPQDYWGNNLGLGYSSGDYYSNPDANAGTAYGLNGVLQSGNGGAVNPPPYYITHGTFRFEDFRLANNAVYTPLIIDSHVPWSRMTLSPEYAFYEILGAAAGGPVTQTQNPRHRGEGLNSVNADGAGHWITREVIFSPNPVTDWNKDNFFWGANGVHFCPGLDDRQPQREW